MDKTFDAASAEPRLTEAWERAGAFRAGANASREETFSILLPPPNVTGTLHMGHAFNHTLMDVLVRWHRMRGFDTLWQPGLDHAGIATQMVVERELAREGNLGRREMGREAFVAKVWEWKARSGGAIVEQDRRLGASMDRSREVFTMDPAYHDAVLKAFVDLYDKDIVYRGKRLVNWDPHFETAISDLEVESVETQGHMWHVRYPLEGGETYEYVERDADGAVTLRETRDYISIATTRPETMLGDGAVAVHPSDERYAPIVGRLCEIPVGPREHRRLIPIITDEYPDPDFGSGAVKITGAHDFNDYAVAKRNGIPLYRLMDGKAAMRADGLPYAEAAAVARDLARDPDRAGEADVEAVNLVPDAYRGMDRYDARRAVVADVDAEGLMIRVEDKTIMQPMGDRSKAVIEPMLTDQWFVDAGRLAGPAVEAVRRGMARAEGSTEGTRILPESEAKVYFNWLENIEPWCISRQLWWGHRIPVWWGPKRADDGASLTISSGPGLSRAETNDVPFCARTEEEAVALAKKYYSSADHVYIHETGDSLNLFNEDGSGFNIPLVQDPDVLDTWFSSALWPLGTMGWPGDTPEMRRYFPSDVLVTGFDILFFWVARMMMMSGEITGRAPFHTVYVHALVRDEQGAKMSKSKGNVIDPLELIDAYGADALRFTLASMASMGRDLRLSEARVEGYRNFATKLWNAARFARMNAATFGGPRPEAALTVNRWILGETGRAREAVDAALAAYRFDAAASALYAFVWGRVCDWYLELAKPLLDDEATAGETRAVMGWVIDQCLILLHPIMPFVTEELWGALATRPKMLVHADWPEHGADLADAQADRETEWVIALIEAVRSVRGEMGVPAGARVPMLEIELGEAERGYYARNAALVERLARTRPAERAAAAPKGAVSVPVPGGLYALPLADVIDVAAERERLERSLGKLGRELGGLRGRLGNPKFVESAPEAVVAETRANLAAREAEEAKLRAALSRLAEVA